MNVDKIQEEEAHFQNTFHQPLNTYYPLTNPFRVFEFDFNSKNPIPLKGIDIQFICIHTIDFELIFDTI